MDSDIQFKDHVRITQCLALSEHMVNDGHSVHSASMSGSLSPPSPGASELNSDLAASHLCLSSSLSLLIPL